MANNYAVVNTDLMSATDDRSRMRSFRYGTWDATKKELTGKEVQNGSIVALNKEMLDRDLWVAVDPTASTPIEELVLVTTPELLYDERLKSLHDFTNEADVNATGMLMKTGDIFSVTVEGFDTTPKVGDKITAQAGTMLKVGGTGTQIGTVVDIWIHNRELYYAVLVG